MNFVNRNLTVIFLVFLNAIVSNSVAQNRIKQIQVKEFGALPSDLIDDSVAIGKALAYAQRFRPIKVILNFEDGKYEFSSNEKESHIALSGMSNIVIKGKNNTEFIMKNVNSDGIVITNSKNITIENISIDYQPLPFTQGTIVAANPEENSFDILIQNGFGSPLAESLLTNGHRKTRAYLFQPNTNRLTHNFLDQYPVRVRGGAEKKLSKIGEQTFRFYSSNSVVPDFVGHKVVIVGRSKFDAIKVSNSDNINISFVDIYSSPSTGFKVTNSEGRTVISNSKIIPKPRTGRLLSTNADGLHAKFNRAKIILKNSVMKSMGDDGVNIGGAYQSIYEQVDDHTLIIEPHKTYRKGDTITITDVNTGIVKTLAIIDKLERVIWQNKAALQVKLKSPLDSPLSLSEDDLDQITDLITSVNTTGENSVILNNTFHNIRGRGIMLHGDYSIVKNNRFTNFRGPGIVIGPDFWWGESSSGSHSVIRGNTFDDIFWNNIIIHGGKTLKPDQKRAIDDVFIVQNTFKNYGRPNPIKGRGEVGPILYLSNTSNIYVADNFFGKPFQASYNGPLVIVDMVQDVSFFENSFEIAPKNWISYGQGTDKSSVVIH
jgi:hypothetical protein